MKLKFIVGDVVMYNNKVVVVDEPSDSYHFDLVNPKECTICCNVYIDEIKQVPLTPIWLENNGWKLCHGFYCSPNEEGVGISLSSQTGYVWDAYTSQRLLRSGINSVSDLQHLLFGLGINHEMEV